MRWLTSIFGGLKNPKPQAEPIEHLGFTIRPNPMSDGGKFRIAAIIEKEVDGSEMTHQLIRSDTLDAYEAAVEASIGKAKQMIDEQGDRLFR